MNTAIAAKIKEYLVKDFSPEKRPAVKIIKMLEKADRFIVKARVTDADGHSGRGNDLIILKADIGLKPWPGDPATSAGNPGSLPASLQPGVAALPTISGDLPVEPAKDNAAAGIDTSNPAAVEVKP